MTSWIKLSCALEMKENRWCHTWQQRPFVFSHHSHAERRITVRLSAFNVVLTLQHAFVVIYMFHMSCRVTSQDKLNQIKLICTWAKLFDAPVAAADVHRQHVLEPGDFWVRVSAGSAQHGGGPGPLDHLQLGTHVDGGEAMRDLGLWKTKELQR